MAWDNNEIRNDIYKELYFNTDTYNNAGMLNLINLADRKEDERQAIAKQGNGASLKARRINTGVKVTKRFAYYQQSYFNAEVVIKERDGHQLTQKEYNHLVALNNRYDRLEQKYKDKREELKQLYGVDVLEITKERLEQDRQTAIYGAKKYKLISTHRRKRGG